MHNLHIYYCQLVSVNIYYKVCMCIIMIIKKNINTEMLKQHTHTHTHTHAHTNTHTHTHTYTHTHTHMKDGPGNEPYQDNISPALNIGQGGRFWRGHPDSQVGCQPSKDKVSLLIPQSLEVSKTKGPQF